MNRFVIADPERCIGCRTCEVACAVSHQASDAQGTVQANAPFHPRLKLVVTERITTPILCRQCEDKPCAMACPNQAIVTENGCVSVRQERCIGCKSCVVACPYGAMNVVVTETAPESDSLFAKAHKKAHALKCDLCGHRADGPACISVCPTQALRLVTPDDLEQERRRKQLASALALQPV